MDIRSYRESRPKYNTRAAFCYRMNLFLRQWSLNISIPYLRDLESGRSVPSLALAVAVEDATAGKVRVRDWPGLKKRMKQRKKHAAV